MHLAALVRHMGALGSSLETPECVGDKPGSFFYRCREVKKKLFSLGTLQVSLEMIVTTYCSMMFKTHLLSFNTPVCFHVSIYLWIYISVYLYSYPSIQNISGMSADSAVDQFQMHLKMTFELTQQCTWMP